jgi:hypothetical protein
MVLFVNMIYKIYIEQGYFLLAMYVYGYVVLYGTLDLYITL